MAMIGCGGATLHDESASELTYTCDHRHTPANGSMRGRSQPREKLLSSARRRPQATTSMGSPMFTVLKYHAALSGLRLIQP